MDKSSIGEVEAYGFRVKKLFLTNNLEPLKNTLNKIQLKILGTRLDVENMTTSDIESFFYGISNFTKDLSKLTDVYKGAELIQDAIVNNKNIALVCDFDSDGINSAAVLYKSMVDIFKVNPNKVRVLVNHRRTGNGYTDYLVERILDEHKKNPIDIICSADHGSSNEDAFKVLKANGISLVITDHHQVPYENYPYSADAFINPQRNDSTYCKNISGCCVAFLTMVATYMKMYNTDNIDVFDPVLPNVAISTITDMMNMAEPINRHIVIKGLNELNSFRNKSWMSTRTALGLPGKINYKNIGFDIGPIINTGSRLGCEELVFDVLTEKDTQATYALSRKLIEQNALRKIITKEATKIASSQAGEYEHTDTVVIIIKTGAGINGIVAANIGVSRGKPTVCFVDNDSDMLTGSCRSIIEGIDIHAVLSAIDGEDHDIFIKYGGHEGAGGCTIYKNKLEKFKYLFNYFVLEQKQHINQTDGLSVDAIVPDYMLTPSFARSVEMCGPYGNKGWPEPIFLTKLKISKIFITGSVARLIFSRKTGGELEAIHFFNRIGEFNVSNIRDNLRSGDIVWVAYNFNVSSYNQLFTTNLTIVDIKKVKE